MYCEMGLRRQLLDRPAILIHSLYDFDSLQVGLLVEAKPSKEMLWTGEG